MIAEMNKALAFLSDKYAVPAGEINCGDGVYRIGKYPLLPWRIERRFVELKKLLENGTLEGVSTLRFSSMTAGGNLAEQVMRELDLATWMVDSPIVSLFATCSGNAVANIVIKLSNNVNVSVECNNKLPPGTEMIDRHEIIARRGVASDQTVDTQVPQSSIYAFTNKGEKRYTDTDAELFGLSSAEIGVVRAAFAVLSEPTLGTKWSAAFAIMQELGNAVEKSDSTGSLIKFQGDAQK
jgi:hypothetical protein